MKGQDDASAARPLVSWRQDIRQCTREIGSKTWLRRIPDAELGLQSVVVQGVD